MRNPRTRWAVGGIALLSLSLSACGGSGFDDTDKADSQASSGPASIKVLIASSGDAETKAVTDAADAWAAKSGNTATVTPAQDIDQQLGQALRRRTTRRTSSTSTPPVRRLRQRRRARAVRRQDRGRRTTSTQRCAQAFTYDGKLYCAPKDFSTLGLQINTDGLWAKAGLTDADVPTTWDQLAAVAQKLTTASRSASRIGDTRDRIGAFMVQAGGWIDQRGRQAGHRRHPGEPRGPAVRQGAARRRLGQVPQAARRRLGAARRSARARPR